MSLGTQFIKACLGTNDTSSFREAKSQLFSEEAEAELFDFVREHLSEYSRLPDEEVVSQAGHALPRQAAQPPAFYIEKLRHRFVFDQINERVPQFRDAMNEQNVPDAIEEIRGMLAGATTQLQQDSFSTLDTLAGEVRDDYEFAKNHAGLRGITTGWATADALTLGLQGGDLVVVAGRTGMGKSWVLANMGYSAWATGHSSLFVSMEMSLVPIARRFVGIHSAVNPNYIRAGELSEFGERALMRSVDEITERGSNAYFLSGDFQKGVSSIEAMVDEFDCEIIYVDAAYLLTPEGRQKGFVSRWESIASVIQELKRLALRVNKPIVISVQMNRNVKKKSDKQLDTVDIAGSDTIPQDASIIFGLRQGIAPFTETRRVVELMKNRDGEESSFNMNFKFSPVNLSEAPATEDAEEMSGVNYML